MNNNLNEFDYESKEFIKLAEDYDNKNKIFCNKKRNRKDLIKNNRKNMKETLIEGLNQPIDKKNKGFQLLMKMGFKEGEAIGKNKKGIIEPINVIDIIQTKQKRIDNINIVNLSENIREINLDHNLKINKKIYEIFEITEKILRNLKIIYNLINHEEINEDENLLLLIKNFCLNLNNSFHIGEFNFSKLSEIINFFITLEIKTNLKLRLTNDADYNILFLEKMYTQFENISEIVKLYAEINHLYCTICNSKFDSISELEEHKQYCEE